MDKKDIIKGLLVHINQEIDCEICPYQNVINCNETLINDAVKLIELQFRPQGEWIEENSETGALGIKYTWLKCNKCGWSHGLVIPKNFCPNCGADMRGKKNG